jgi:hypothetical protein
MNTKVRVLLYCLLGGLPMLVAALGGGSAISFWLSGVVLAAAFVPIALFGPRGVLRQFVVVLPVLMLVTVLCTWTEALLFAQTPEFQEHALRNLLGAGFAYLMVTAALSLLAAALKLNRAVGPTPSMVSAGRIAISIVGAGLVYAAFYLVVGAVTYQWFTKQYYPNAEEIVARLGPWFWPLQIGRGMLMALAVLPAIFTLRMTRAHAAVAIGVLIWVAGGAAPLLLPNPLMIAAQRYIHIVEILGQNLPLGIAVVLLVRKREPKLAPLPAHAA